MNRYRQFWLFLAKSFALFCLVVFSFIFTLKPRGLVEVGCIVSAGAALCQFLAMLRYIRHPSEGWRLAVIGISGIALVVLSLKAGLILRDAIFRSNLPDYRKAVSSLTNGVTSQSLEGVSLPLEYSHLATAVLAEKTDGQAITVVFIIGGAFPVKHAGYVYRSTDRIDDWSNAKLFASRFRRVAPYWFGF